MLTKDTVERIVDLIKFRDWRFRVLEKGDGFLVQPLFDEHDCNTGFLVEQHARKWFVSRHACMSEVVQTVYAAIQRAIAHEVAEAFTFAGERVYDPHIDIYELVKLASVAKRDIRDPMPQPQKAVVKDPAAPLIDTQLRGPGPAPEDGREHWSARPNNDPWF